MEDLKLFQIEIPNNDTVFLLSKNVPLSCAGYAHGYYNKLGLFKRSCNPLHEIHYLFSGVMTKVNNDPFHAGTRPTMKFDIYIPESYLKEEIYNKRENWQVSST